MFPACTCSPAFLKQESIAKWKSENKKPDVVNCQSNIDERYVSYAGKQFTWKYLLVIKFFQFQWFDDVCDKLWMNI